MKNKNYLVVGIVILALAGVIWWFSTSQQLFLLIEPPPVIDLQEGDGDTSETGICLPLKTIYPNQDNPYLIPDYNPGSILLRATVGGLTFDRIIEGTVFPSTRGGVELLEPFTYLSGEQHHKVTGDFCIPLSSFPEDAVVGGKVDYATSINVPAPCYCEFENRTTPGVDQDIIILWMDETDSGLCPSINDNQIIVGGIPGVSGGNRINAQCSETTANNVVTELAITLGCNTFEMPFGQCVNQVTIPISYTSEELINVSSWAGRYIIYYLEGISSPEVIVGNGYNVQVLESYTDPDYYGHTAGFVKLHISRPAQTDPSSHWACYPQVELTKGNPGPEMTCWRWNYASDGSFSGTYPMTEADLVKLGLCGNGVCDPIEEGTWLCLEDCGEPPQTCGDEHCTGTETYWTCQHDCSLPCNNNGICDTYESPHGCWNDCSICGDLLCSHQEDCETCLEDCGTCPLTSYCGDGICSPDETEADCAMDCTSPPIPFCGDDVCSGIDTCINCEADCGVCTGQPTWCGDGTCDNYDERCNTCPEDCGVCKYCGDDNCDWGETCETCSGDCGACETCTEDVDCMGLLAIDLSTGTKWTCVGGICILTPEEPPEPPIVPIVGEDTFWLIVAIAGIIVLIFLFGRRLRKS